LIICQKISRDVVVYNIENEGYNEKVFI